jgi:hypothetical protein
MTQRAVSKLPSPGFGFLVSSYGVLAAFLAWGFATPQLDRATRIIQRMRESGFAGLRPTELETLSTALRRHPGLADALAERSPVGFIEPTSDGYSSLAVSHVLVRPVPGTALRIIVSCRGESGAFPLTLSFLGEGIAHTVRCDRPGQADFLLPQGQPHVPALLSVTLTTAAAASASRLDAQIAVDGQPDAPGTALP